MSFIDLFFGALGVSFAIWRLGRRSRFFIHTFQLFGYTSGPFSAWLVSHFRDAVLRTSHAIGILILVMGWLWELPIWLAFGLWAFAFASSKRYRRDKPKKSLAWTPRVYRLAVGTGLLLLIASIGVAFITPFNSPYLKVLAAFWIADFGSPFILLVASFLLVPVEKSIQNGFKNQARARLGRRPDLKIVAITGSYGKTSVKFAIHEILSQRFPTLTTPGSYNTPMGICKVINSDLTDEHRYAVLEMGMRHPGDIAELCDIAKPDVAVITSVGSAHLEYMGSIEAIAKEKASLLSFLSPEGVAVLNADDERVLAMREGLRCEIITVSVTSNTATVWADKITYGPEGAQFNVHSGAQSESFSTKLLGKHNVLNVVMAVAVGLREGLTLRQMSHAIARLEPVEHRLKLSMRNGLHVLDDAFNSNPIGAANAVEVLGQFKTGRRIVITPGMIELGHQEAALNRLFGTQIAQNADEVLLVGQKRTLPIAEGLKDANYPDLQIHVVNSLFEAQDWLAANAKPGDVVLYENDLPDQFNEV
ncbi:MAG: UDP-N-acetylmuramoyl-tripeptide--D-alanyl-D-alanine ligase [Bacteroidetes bacterium]|nr:UDP-N-acetylmuramoyl-tripeptide--D-alanyl-D-alanine ligase [Bacteroidota bacterium]